MLIPLLLGDSFDFNFLTIHYLIVQYYTDPVSHRVFRTLKSVMSYLETGEITKHAYIPRRSVTHMYSFDKCTDLVFGLVLCYCSFLVKFM